MSENPQEPGVLDLQNGEDAYFVGFAETPKVDRRFLTGAALALAASGFGLGAGLAAGQRPAGTGTWDQAAVRDWTGVVEKTPYPALRLLMDGRPVRALLATTGKCAVGARVDRFTGGPARVTGSLIRKGDLLMIAVADGPDWIGAADVAASMRARLAPPPDRLFETVAVAGEILDSKCWFGAMRPARGKAHKACAALCIRGGIPPAFFVKRPDGRVRSFLLTDAARGPLRETILPHVADPVRLSGRFAVVDNLPEFRADVTTLTRL